MTILVTGAKGMIGAQLVSGLLEAGHTVIGVDRVGGECGSDGRLRMIQADLADRELLSRIVAENGVDRIIHLAALAHSQDGKQFSWEDYRHLNVECAKNVFDAAGQRPVLFISTVDVYGFTSGTVGADTQPHPVSHYAKSKAMAELECRKLPHFTIFRFSPVYTETLKRDIQKRYYLRYPTIAYRIGRGMEYEVLNIKKAVASMVQWCTEEPKNDIRIIKDAVRLKTTECIQTEREAGRAKLVLWFPKWSVNGGYLALKALTGKNKYTYLVNKAVHPLRTEGTNESK